MVAKRRSQTAGKMVWFEEKNHPNVQKTRYFEARNKKTGLLGNIRWKSGYNRYVFTPEPVVLGTRELIMIARFCLEQNQKKLKSPVLKFTDEQVLELEEIKWQEQKLKIKRRYG